MVSTRFHFRLLAPRGRCLSGWRSISGGKPQGENLSPSTWLLFFNPVAESVGRLQEEWPDALRSSPSRVWVCAGDVVSAAAHPSAATLCEIAGGEAADGEGEVWREGIALSLPKSLDFLIS